MLKYFCDGLPLSWTLAVALVGVRAVVLFATGVMRPGAVQRRVSVVRTAVVPWRAADDHQVTPISPLGSAGLAGAVRC